MSKSIDFQKQRIDYLRTLFDGLPESDPLKAILGQVVNTSEAHLLFAREASEKYRNALDKSQIWEGKFHAIKRENNALRRENRVLKIKSKESFNSEPNPNPLRP